MRWSSQGPTIFVLLAAAAAGLPLAAFAQSSETGGAAGGAVSGTPQLETIIITAEKRPERLQDVPAAVTVLSGAELEEQHATQMTDWASYVPGLSVFNRGGAGGPGGNTVTLEGVAPLSSAGTVAIYLDGAPVSGSSSFEGNNSFSADLLPFDLSRIEVLKGPQGTLYGANAMGGVIRYVSEPPNLTKFNARLGADAFGVNNASDVRGNVRTMLNAPLVTDELGLRLTGFDQNTPGYIDNKTTGKSDINGLRQRSGHLQLLWQHTPDLSVQASVLLQRTRSDNSAVVALDQTTEHPLAGDLTNINTRNEPFSQDLDLYSLSASWDLKWAALTLNSSYLRLDDSSTLDETSVYGPYLPFLGLPSPGQADIASNAPLHKFTQEVRLASPSGTRWEWMVGGYYTHEKAKTESVLTAYDLSGTPQVSPVNPLSFVTATTYKESAAYGNVTFHFTDRFDITGGARYAHNNQDFNQTNLAGGVPTLVAPGKSSEGVWTYLGNARFHITHDAIAYARVATGYQPGGPNLVVPPTPTCGSPPVVGCLPAQFNSSRLVDYQVGLKGNFLDGRAALDLSAFLIDWKDIQIPVFLPGGTSIGNAGGARSKGGALTVTYLPMKGLSLVGNAAYTDAYLTTAAPGLSAADGAQLPGVPTWTASLVARYSWGLRGAWNAFVGGGYRYTGRMFTLLEGNALGIDTKSYGAADLNLGVTDSAWKISLYARNLTDERAYTGGVKINDLLGIPIDIRAPVLQPRTIGVSVDRSF